MFENSFEIVSPFRPEPKRRNLELKRGKKQSNKKQLDYDCSNCLKYPQVT